jgi:hypothetical protein
MAVIAFVSAKGSPGATVAALACTLSWGHRLVLAECDPAGGSIMDGFLQAQLDGNRGLLPLAVAELRNDRLAAEFWGQLVDLDAPRRERLLLPGLTDPAQSGSLNPIWDRVAAYFAQLEYTTPSYDVIADCGRLAVANPPWPLVGAADAVLLTVRPTLPSVSAAVPAVAALRRQLTERTASTSALGLVVTGAGPYQPTEVAKQLKVPLVAHLPADPRTADVLSYGGDVRANRGLMRAAAAAETKVRALIAHHRQLVPPRAIRVEAPSASN